MFKAYTRQKLGGTLPFVLKMYLCRVPSIKDRQKGKGKARETLTGFLFNPKAY
ncbi:MAG: hypothetical protein GY800_10665 [Planctomycetes bacterium]|nr:hypothetical protein [Planctomycetota bacterium]